MAVVKAIDAPTLWAALNNGLTAWMGDETSNGQFPQVGGFRFGFDPTLNITSRLVNAMLSVNGVDTPLSSYTGSIVMVSNQYVAGGGNS